MKGVRKYFYAVPEGLDFSKEVGLLLDTLPEWRRERVLSYRYDLDRFLCAKAFLLLEDALRRDFGIRDGIEFSYSPEGKPFLAGHPEIHFNLSHCRKAVACVISDAPVGVDVEEIQFDDQLAQSVLSPEEYGLVISSANPAESFTSLWTKKESYLKMLGCGIIVDLKSLELGGAEFETETCSLGYCSSICSEVRRRSSD